MVAKALSNSVILLIAGGGVLDVRAPVNAQVQGKEMVPAMNRPPPVRCATIIPIVTPPRATETTGRSIRTRYMCFRIRLLI